MSRSTVVYLVMIVVLVGGLWGVLAVGNRLSPPEDLAGAWVVQTDGGPVPMTVEQSDRFFQMAVGKQSSIDLKRVGPTDGPTHLVGGPWAVDFDPAANGGADDRFVRVTGPVPLQGVAHRVSRKYPVETHGADK